MTDKYYVTTPIYYVNAEPHIGHAYTTILADVLTRFNKMFGSEAFFLTGTDEHGQKVQSAAEALGMSPQQHCDEMMVRFKNLWSKLEIEYDDFIRTTEPRHLTIVAEILQRLWDKGEIYPDEFEGWYCVHDERFWTEKDLIEDTCPLCRRPVNKMSEKNYFFRMNKYQRWLVDYIEEHPLFILPQHRKNEVLGFLRQPLKDLCISRPKSRLNWGIPLPFDEDYVTYVWFDALLNYYTAARDRGIWPATVHLIGKDILTTHSVYWPIMLKAAGLELPRTIFAHGWWLVEDTKMSKSLGNVVKPLAMMDSYGVEPFRYFLMREMSPGSDASFSEEALVKRINNDLANDLGNLLSRLTRLLQTFFQSKAPEPGAIDPQWRSLCLKTVESVKDSVDDFRVDEAVIQAMNPVREANRYLEEKAPWKLAKKDKAAAGHVLYNALEGLRLSAILLKPVIPEKSGEILRRLGAEDTGLEWGGLKPGNEITAGSPLFPRIELEKIEAPDTEMTAVPEQDNLISLDDFKKVELRVGQIVAAEKIEGADKLLKIQVDIGDEKRQLVAGIASYYTLDELAGKKIIVAANLKKAVLRGVESQGMLLAAVKGKKLRLLTVDGDIPNGAKIS